MKITAPTHADVKTLAAELGLALSADDVAFFGDLLAGGIPAAYGPLDAEPDCTPAVKYPRTPGYMPGPDEDPHHAWYYKTAIKGARSGPLKGRRVAVKDNVCVAGVPMLTGASTMEGYVPDIDATIVGRILDAGGEIAGKTHCEYFCFSGSSHLNQTGATHNPYRRGVTAGGSSSGSAAAVAAGEVDMAIGGDQGGSIRMPASFCGVYGMKPTWGLVPYTGIMPIEIFVDHTGPMTANVSDNALMLEVIAGDDGYDPRIKAPKPKTYSKLLEGGIKGLKIGVVKEGFGLANSEKDVDAKVKDAAKRFGKLGAKVEEVSIPMHLVGHAIWTPIGVEGLTQTMMWGDGYGVSRPDLYVTSLMDFHHGWRYRANELSETTKLFTMLGTYIHRQHGVRYYGKSVNLVRRLTAAYDAALATYDLLLMPTLPIKASPIPGPGASREEYVQRALEIIANTCPFNLTHHPAMSVPCGLSAGLPIGCMLIGKHFEEATIYRAAYAFEQSGDWKKF